MLKEHICRMNLSLYQLFQNCQNLPKFNQNHNNGELLLHLKLQIFIWYTFYPIWMFSYFLMAAHCVRGTIYSSSSSGCKSVSHQSLKKFCWLPGVCNLLGQLSTTYAQIHISGPKEEWSKIHCPKYEQLQYF